MHNIKKLLKENGYNYFQLSKMLGCSKTFAWQIINGHRKLSYEQAILIASIFNMKPDRIFYEDFINNDAVVNKISELKKIKKEISIELKNKNYK